MTSKPPRTPPKSAPGRDHSPEGQEGSGRPAPTALPMIPNHVVDVVLAVDDDGNLSLRSPPEASQDDRVYVAMLRLRIDIVMGAAQVIKRLMLEATAEGPDPPEPELEWGKRVGRLVCAPA